MAYARPLAENSLRARASGFATFFACLALVRLASASLPPQPRHLEYRVAWNGIPAAWATIEIAPGEIAGADSFVVQASARTNAFVDLFWAFRGMARATLLADGLTPVEFVYDRQMAGRTYLTRTSFDEQGAHSVYTREDRQREFDIEDAGIIDPITAVFRARLSGARPGDILHYDIWTGEARYRVQLDVQGSEQIDVPAGRFNALRIVPEVWKVAEQPELDTRLRRATIWVGDDPARTLLRIRSEIFIGAVTLDLLKTEPLA